MSYEEDRFTAERESMVENYLLAERVAGPAVLEAMGVVPRHRFMLPKTHAYAYHDQAMPIGEDQTISQPSVVAIAIEAAQIQAGHRVLDVGAGSGYQSALLSELGAEVFAVERHPSLARAARAALIASGYPDVKLKEGDGWRGWPEAGPFDAILLGAAPPHVPPELLHQLKPGGRMVLPVGDAYRQVLQRWTRTGDRWDQEDLLDVLFVPLIQGMP